MVYLVEADNKRFLKIGCSDNIDHRLTNLRCTVPLKLNLLKTIEGGVEVEKFLHNRYSHLRVQGEWFIYTKEITDEFDNGAKIYAESKLDAERAIIERHRKLSVNIRNHIAWKFLFYILSYKPDRFTGSSQTLHAFNLYLHREKLEEISRSTWDRAMKDLLDYGAIKKITHTTYCIND